jgi:hypothetical protein
VSAPRPIVRRYDKRTTRRRDSTGTAIANASTSSAAASRNSADRAFRDSLFAHDGRFRLCANGLAFSRSVIRTGVPGSSKNSRMELTR